MTASDLRLPTGPPNPGTAYAVDPEAVDVLGAVLVDTARALGPARARLARVRAGAPLWAVDGNLPRGFGRLLDALEWALQDAGDLADGLADRLALVGPGYRAADRPLGGDGGMRSGP